MSCRSVIMDEKSRRVPAALTAALLLFIVECTSMDTKPAADLVITNAKVWTPDKTLPAAEGVAVIGDRIVAAYTIGSAYAEFQEKEKGSITPGKLADMVILNADIFKIQPAVIREVKVETTIVGGKVVYRTQ